jgi:hypothetical protein
MIGSLFKMYAQFKHYFAKMQVLELNYYQLEVIFSLNKDKALKYSSFLSQNKIVALNTLKNVENEVLISLQEKIFFYRAQYQNLVKKSFKVKSNVNILKAKYNRMLNKT